MITETEHQQITEWQERLFGDEVFEARIKKLKEEISEFKDSAIGAAPKSETAIEFADCFFCLLSCATKAGLSFSDLRSAILEKFAINQARKWKKNPDGHYSHVK